MKQRWFRGVDRALFRCAVFVGVLAWSAQASAGIVGERSTASSRARALNPSRLLYVSDRSQNKIFVYSANTRIPIGTITRGIIQAQGLALDRHGNVYLANGNGGNVLEYAPGGAGPIKMYAIGLRHPVNVTIDAGGTLYVAEQSPSSIVKFTTASPASPVIYPLPNPNDPVRGVAVDSAGDIYATISGIGDSFPLTGSCLAVTGLYVIPFGTRIALPQFLRSNEQAFGLAIDDDGTLYAADPCLNNVAAYSLPKLTFQGYVRDAGPFNQPFYLTIANGFLSVPSAGEGSSGYVTTLRLTARSMSRPSKPLTRFGPISAAVGPALPI